MDLTAMPHLDDLDGPMRVIDPIDDAIVALAVSKEGCLSCELFTARGLGLGRQRSDPTHDPLTVTHASNRLDLL